MTNPPKPNVCELKFSSTAGVFSRSLTSVRFLTPSRGQPSEDEGWCGALTPRDSDGNVKSLLGCMVRWAPIPRSNKSKKLRYLMPLPAPPSLLPPGQNERTAPTSPLRIQRIVSRVAAHLVAGSRRLRRRHRRENMMWLLVGCCCIKGSPPRMKGMKPIEAPFT